MLRKPLPRWTRPGTAAALAAAAIAFAGCGDLPSVESGTKQAVVAACRQAASAIEDPTARSVADGACRSKGKVADAGPAAKQAARRRCLQETAKIVDPAARRAVRALCPAAS